MISPSVTVIDYGSGNLHSIVKALEAVGGTVTVSADPSVLSKSERIVLPGVGAFADCYHGLNKIAGIESLLHEHAVVQKRPFLGICVGMQLLAEYGLEHEKSRGLGWFQGEVVPLELQGRDDLKVPHMGWNVLDIEQNHPVFNGIESGSHFYFVHSYHMKCRLKADVYATVQHGSSLTATVCRDNIVASQFHPEKSQSNGLKFLENFLMV